MVTRFFPLLLLLAGLPCIAVAQAGNSDLPPVDKPGVWHRVTPDNETTSHKCVGDPRTVHCTLTTLYACIERSEPDLCRLIQYSTLPNPRDFPRMVYSWYEYRIVKGRRLSANSRIDRENEGPVEPQDGDLLLGVIENTCVGSLSAPKCGLNVEKRPLMYLQLRRQGEIWTVIRRHQKRY
ncbi:hypothetical protein [Ferrovibrio terrae]|uniref:hypothetical protein n=1 Tax=Ferrovibrio terrae TaxID=2594003 RepID=UPI0031378981